MSVSLFQAIFATAPGEARKGLPSPLPVTMAFISAHARLAAEETPLGICYGVLRHGPRVMLRVGFSTKGELYLPMAGDAAALDWQGKELGYPPRSIFLREVRVRRCGLPVHVCWWLARCRRRAQRAHVVAVPLVLLLERPPGVVSLLNSEFANGLAALRVDCRAPATAEMPPLPPPPLPRRISTTGTRRHTAHKGTHPVFFDCEKELPALRHARAVALVGRSVRSFPGLPSLATLPALRVLTLAVMDLADVDWFARCRVLRVLQLSGCVVRLRLHSLATLRGMHIVSLEACDARDLDPLTTMRGLRVLRVCFSSYLSELGALGKLPNLEVLDVRECVRLVDVTGLASAPRLRWLSLRGTPVADVDAVATLPSLRYLDLAHCDNLLRLPPALGKLPHLYELDVSRSGLVHLDGLAGAESLRRLLASHCYNLVSIAALRGATDLVELGISGTPVECLDALAEAEHLRILTADSTAIQHLDSLARCTRLEHVSVRSCPGLRRVEGLRGLPLLRFVDVRGCAQLEDLEGLLAWAAKRKRATTVLHGRR